MAHQLLQVALSLTVGAIVQSTLGFGMGMVATPLLVWNHVFTLPEAIGALVPNILAQTAFACWRFRKELPWREVREVCLYRCLGLPVGVWALEIVAEQGVQACRAVLGGSLLGALIVQQFSSRQRESQPPGRLGTFVAAFASGFLAGLVGMGGPPLVLWVMRQNWPTSRQRTFLWLSFLLIMPLQIILMTDTFGRPWIEALGLGTLVVPLTVAVAAWTGRWAERWSKQRLRFGMRLFLLVIAARLIVQWYRGE